MRTIDTSGIPTEQFARLEDAASPRLHCLSLSGSARTNDAN